MTLRATYRSVVAKACVLLAASVIASLVLLCLPVASCAQGQGPLSVSVDQPRMELVWGYQKALWITIFNNGTTIQTINLILDGDYKQQAWVDQTQVTILPGQRARINMTLYAPLDKVRPGAYTLIIWAKATSANLSAQCLVEITVREPSRSDSFSIWYLLPLLLVPLIAGLITYRIMTRMQRMFKVFEVFLVYNDGRLIRHFPETIDKEGDISKSALFSAIQDFMSEAFDYEGSGGEIYLREVVFGQIKIFVERGPTFYVAVVAKGDAPKDLRKKISDILSSVGGRFEDVLEDWDGDLTPFEDIVDVNLEDLSLSYTGPAVKKRKKAPKPANGGR